MKNTPTVIFLMIVLSSCMTNTDPVSNKQSSKWELVYRNDKEGKPIYGSKEDLMEAVRHGCPIRVGWASRRKSDSTKSVEHISDATFTTIANQREVFVQITPFLAQRPDLNSDTLSMTLIPSESSWILGTNGLISSISKDFRKDTVFTSDPKLFGYGLSWFVHKRDGSLEKVNLPLWDVN